MTSINFYGQEWYKNQRLTKWGFKSPITNLRSQAQIVATDGEMKSMASIRESAENYVSPETLNIVELKAVSTEMDLKHKVVNEGTEDEFSYDYILVDEKEYRVPKSVIKQLQAQLKEKPDWVSFKVTKTGTGLKTEYSVIMLE